MCMDELFHRVTVTHRAKLGDKLMNCICVEIQRLQRSDKDVTEEVAILENWVRELTSTK